MPNPRPPATSWLGDHRGPLTVTDNFAVLDDPVEQETFTQRIEQADGDLAESVLMVQGMYCAACADTVESALQDLPGVQQAQVHAATRRLTVRWDPAATRMSSLAQVVGERGYRLLPMQQALSISERLRETRQGLWRLFVAGFCMMQVMMYAWPAYVTEPGEIPADIDQLLRWASWVLSLPVVFFASGPFFESAWRDLKHGRVGMDTPVSIGILVTFLVSSAATFDPTGPWGDEVWFDSLTMFVFFLLGGRYLEFKARDRTAGALDSLMNRLPEVCERETAKGVETVSIRRLAVGDVVRVQAGQAFPADGELLSERATVDEALLTGESRPVTREAGQGVVAGSFNLGGPVRMRVMQVGRDTRFAQIVKLMEQASTEKPRLAILADRIAAPFLVLVLLAAAVAGCVLVADRPHPGAGRGGGGAHRHLPVCAVAGHAGGHAEFGRSAGAPRRSGAPAAGLRDAGQHQRGGVRQDRHADPRPAGAARSEHAGGREPRAGAGAGRLRWRRARCTRCLARWRSMPQDCSWWT